MALQPGTFIGPYEVIAALGEGGMGVVHRGRDTKLQRDVALKLLPDHLASDADRLARLEREAQVLASLNHPHIAHVYGLEQSSGVSCIVMELVDGPTLGDLIVEKPTGIPTEDARRIALQIVAGLEAAHERGIVHRDLKPANIKVTRDGAVKILDFGLAKAGPESVGSVPRHFTQSPTVLATSLPGVILGTLAYMSPEQARGLAVDVRSDIWAFGCVLYEMLTGRQAFHGETATDVIAKIVTAPPDWDRLPSDTPASIRRLLRAALEKDPKQRLQHIGDARLFLIADAEPTAAPIARTPVSRHARSLVGGLAIALVGALVPATMYFLRQPPKPLPIQFEMPATGLAAGGVVNGLAMSPDGSRLAYIAAIDGKRAVWIRQTGSVSATPVPGTEDASGAIFWSPDGRHIGFYSAGSLKTVDLSGGMAQSLADTPINASGTWNRDGIILFAAPETTTFAGLRRVSAQGGTSTTIEPRDGLDQAFRIQPQFLPDGRHFLYHANGGSTGGGRVSGLFASFLDSPSSTMVMALEPESSRVFYASPGYLLFTRNGVLMAQPFDADSLQLKGTAQAVVEDVGDFSASENGRLVYRPREARGDTPAIPFQLTWFDRSGKPAGQLGAPAPYSDLVLSRDGQRVAVASNQSGNPDIWTIDVLRSVPQRVTFEPVSEGSPAWSPNGDRLAFTSARRGAGPGRRSAGPGRRVGRAQLPEGPVSGPGKLYEKLSSGLGESEMLNADASKDDYRFDTVVELPQAWSTDDRYLVFLHFNAPTASRVRDIWVLPLTGDRKAFPLVESPFLKGQVQLSPDSRWMAYTTNESGAQQIVVQSFPDPARVKTQITATGGSEPRWRRDGRELFYLRPDGKLMVVPVGASKTTFDVGTPAEVFQTPLTAVANPLTFRYDVAPDGQRFLLRLPVSPSKDVSAPTRPITAVINWTALLSNSPAR